MKATSQFPSRWQAPAVFTLLILVLGNLQLAQGQKGVKYPSPRSILLQAQVSLATDQEWKDADVKLAGPFIHKNLTIFLVHGPDTIKDLHLLPLAEALKEKKVVIRETGGVNELLVDKEIANHSLCSHQMR
jgi:hypothetical protein